MISKQRVMQLVQAQHFKEAKAMCRKVCKQSPNDAEAWFLLGAINGQLGNFKEAESCCRQVLKLQPNHAGIHYNLAVALAQQDKMDESTGSFEQAIRLNPQYTEAYLDLGNTLQRLGRIDQAIKNYLYAIHLQPTLSIAHNKLGHIYSFKGNMDKAEAHYLHALKIKPDYDEACSGLANIYINQIRLTEAIKLLEPVIGQLSDSAELYIKLSVELMLQGEHEQSLACLQKILSLYPDHAEARWAYTILQIPSIYTTTDAPARCRLAFSRELTQLEIGFNNYSPGEDYLTIGNQHPFFLAYQEENNRKLLARHGSLLVRIMAEWFDKQNFSIPRKSPGNRVKAGILSPHLLDHSVWDAIVKGWFQHLDKSKVELYTFHISNAEDNETALARDNSAFYVHGNKSLPQWVEIVLNKQLDILIYPEVGMDPMTAKLACLRLAPVQMAAWGHPETTGLPTMDYYLSAEEFEPDNAQACYSEKLIALPNLGCYYHPLSIIPNDPDWKNLTINPEIPILLCPGMPFKYAPRYDWIFVEIARELDECQFVFFQHESLGHLPEKLRNRLKKIFDEANLEFDNYIKFIPWQKKPEFYGLMKHSNIFMDTIGFSGFNTAMQAVECGLPVVTGEGKFMRGRLASGILRRMKLTELIATNEKEYVSLVIKIIRDTEYRGYLHQFIKTNRHMLFDDLAPVRALEDFFINVMDTSEHSA